MWGEKVLSKREVLFFFVVVSLVYIFPFVHADYTYVDDSWRSLLLWGEAWRAQGRVLLEIFIKFLAFNNASINIFPLPLLIATFAISLAMTRLTFWFFSQPRLASCLVVLPILCSPFFLGNITYQYDGPGMMLAVVAAIYAVIYGNGGFWLRGFSIILIVVMLGIYQLTVTVFISLCFVECVWGVRNKKEMRDVLSILCWRGLQLVIGGGLYYLAIFQMVVSKRMEFSSFDMRWLEGVTRKYEFSMGKVLELVNSGNLYFIIPVLLFSCVGFVMIVVGAIMTYWRPQEKTAAIFFCFCAIPVLMFSIPGAMLFAAEPYLQARNYLGFSVVLVFLFLMSYEFLGCLHRALRLLLVIPILWMFSFCYAYGQIIVAKKELEMAVATFVAYDLVSAPELREVEVFYFIGARSGGNWLPRGYGAKNYMPVLDYILSDSNVLLHANFLTRLGINNVVDGNRDMFKIAVSGSRDFRSILDRKFYSIYMSEAGTFLVMKDLDVTDAYLERP
ncbi:glucosyltransferase domain-containing protein [Pseudomonas kielensis]|uniref:glucosyltransferase domain-containing protein n=1 Tax=Pseudomonas kielensis TaxID=2762577 RepID=UPI0038A20AD8